MRKALVAQTRGEAMATGQKTTLYIRLIHEDQFTRSGSNSITRGQKGSCSSQNTTFLGKYPGALPPSRRTKIFRSRINQGSGAIINCQVQCLTSTRRSSSADTDNSIRTLGNRRIYNGHISIESNWRLCAWCAPLAARLHHLRSAIRCCCLYQN